MSSHNLEYAYASVLTAFPAEDTQDHQDWHRDTPDNEESSDHQLTLMIYLTEVYRENGATEFKLIDTVPRLSCILLRSNEHGFLFLHVERAMC